MRVRGFFRVQMGNPSTGRIIGDSSWVQNRVVDNGFDVMLAFFPAGPFNRSRLSSSTTPLAQTATTFAGSLTMSAISNKVIATRSNLGGGTVRFIQTYNGTELGTASPQTIGSFALFDNIGGLLAGQTFASSQWTSTQNLTVTYEIQIATA